MFRRAGYRSLTPLQEHVIPLALRGKDIAVQSPAGSGRTTAAVVSLIVGARGSSPAPAALAIVASPEEVDEFSREWTRFSRLVRDAPALLALGGSDDTRREQRRLEKGGSVVVGTAERVIDHIRRGSLSFDALQTVIVQAPDPVEGTEAAAAPPGGTWATPGSEQEAFVRDAQFVFAKLPAHRQAVLFTGAALESEGELVGLLHRPSLLSAQDLVAGTGGDPERHDLAVHLAGQRPADALAPVILGGAFPATVVLHGPRTDGQALAAGLRRAVLRAEAVPGPAGSALRRRHVAAFAARELDALVLPFPQSGLLPGADLEELRPTHLVYCDIPQVRPPQAQRSARQPGPSTPQAAAPAVVVLVADGQERELERLQEAIGVSLKSSEVPGRDEMLGGAVRRIMERLKGEADQEGLARVRRAVRRAVPFTMRSWFAAYLLRSQLLPGGSEAAAQGPVQGRQQRDAGPRREPVQRREGRPSERPTERPQGRPGDRPQARPAERQAAPRAQRQPRPERARPAAPQQVPPPADGAPWTQLFVNIGRNRRVFAEDLSALFSSTLGLAPSEMGEVRVFDKYSFVDIAPARAADAIARVTGAELKGRPISVNYAKKKEEKEAR